MRGARRMVRQGTGQPPLAGEETRPMGEPPQGDRSDRYWRIRVWLELIKLGVWIGLEWFGHGGPNGPR
jgi:hypothetical protein